MYPATKSSQVSFHMLHKKDCGRIKNQRVCSECGEVVDYDELIKGFEYEKGEYVPVTDEEMKKAKPEATETIQICNFVDLDEIDPVYFDSPYYLVPSKKSDKIYVLLREALKKSNKVGIASFVLRTKQYLAAVRPLGDALVLNTMHYSDEVREAEDMPAADTSVSDKEMEMAVQIIDAMSEEHFEPDQYKDTYNEALTTLIESKLAGKEIKTKTAGKQEPTNVLDLMSRLKASLEQAGSEAAPKTEEKKAPAGKTAAKKSSSTKAAAKPRAKTAAKTATEKPAAAKKAKLKLVA
jgi:DNA end-binding protein Ku